MTDTNIVHVPYRGAAPAMTDLLGGQVQMMFPSTASSIAHVKAGKLRALGVTSATRWEMLPDVPAIGEFVPGFETSFWAGVGAPKATSGEIIGKLNSEINVGLAVPKIRAQLVDLGGVAMPMSQTQQMVIEFGELRPDYQRDCEENGFKSLWYALESYAQTLAASQADSRAEVLGEFLASL